MIFVNGAGSVNNLVPAHSNTEHTERVSIRVYVDARETANGPLWLTITNEHPPRGVLLGPPGQQAPISLIISNTNPAPPRTPPGCYTIQFTRELPTRISMTSRAETESEGPADDAKNWERPSVTTADG